MPAIHSTPGTYMILLKLSSRSNIKIGRTRRVSLERGLYCYVGSALGPGGFTARLRRYASIGMRKHWHVDYLLPHAELIGALVIEDSSRYECSWASWVGRLADSCIDGFGASDCRCSGHLFYLGESLDKDQFVNKAQEDLRARHVSKQEMLDLVG